MFRVGIDIGGTSCKIGIVDQEGKILFKDSMRTHRERDPDVIIEELGMTCKKLIDNSKIGLGNIKSIGVGCPGTPDKKNGVLIYTNNINFDYTDIRGMIQKHVDKDLYLDNDANCAALAESLFGACKGSDYSFTITLGTGVGSGGIINGRLYSGSNYGAPEIGHMVIEMDGKRCTCGRRGCFEQYASATSLIEDTKEAIINNPGTKMMELIENDLSKVSAKTSFMAMRMGDGIAAKVVDSYIHNLAQGLINIINIFQPEIIALGGGVSNEGEVLLNMLNPLIGREIYTKKLKKNCKLVLATMGNDAGIIGAAFLDE